VPTHLREARNPRLESVPDPVGRIELPEQAVSHRRTQRMRARAHDAHVAEEHVKQLWKLVDAGCANELANTCDAWILPPRGDGPDRVRGFAPHRSELENGELTTSLSDANLPEKHRSGALELNQDRHRSH